MTTTQQIEQYISDLHYNEQTKIFAFEVGKFLFAFIGYINSTDFAEKTKREHIRNVKLIGHFECGYGYTEEFEPSIFEYGPHYVYEYERKVSSSKFAMQSYAGTWRKLDKFIKSGEYVEWTKKVEEAISNEK
jgi:hypothetical protein